MAVKTNLSPSVRRLEARLRRRPFVGTLEELAAHIQMNVGTLGHTLQVIRSPEFIEQHGWTIPYVDRTGGDYAYLNVWRIVDGRPADNDTMQRSQRHRRHRMLKATQRDSAQSWLASIGTKPGSDEAEYWQAELRTLDAVESDLTRALTTAKSGGNRAIRKVDRARAAIIASLTEYQDEWMPATELFDAVTAATGVGTRTIQKARKQLADDGVIEVRTLGGGAGRWLWRLVP